MLKTPDGFSSSGGERACAGSHGIARGKEGRAAVGLLDSHSACLSLRSARERPPNPVLEPPPITPGGVTSRCSPRSSNSFCCLSVSFALRIFRSVSAMISPRELRRASHPERHEARQSRRQSGSCLVFQAAIDRAPSLSIVKRIAASLRSCSSRWAMRSSLRSSAGSMPATSNLRASSHRLRASLTVTSGNTPSANRLSLHPIRYLTRQYLPPDG